MRGAAAGLLVLALAGCAPAARTPVDSMEALAADEIMLVGRVELLPPLKKGEQHVRGMGTGGFENTMLLITDERLRPLPRDPALADYAGRIEAPLGTTFFVRSRGGPFYVLGGILFLEVGAGGMDRAYFPGGLRVAARPGDRAIYIGTLRYHRDEFFEISRMAVVDDFNEANAEFVRQFGARYPLRKVLMKPN